MTSSMKTLITELEENIVPGMLEETVFNLSYHRRRLERLAGILKFQEPRNCIPFGQGGKNENGFHIRIASGVRKTALKDQTYCECYSLFKEPEKYFIKNNLSSRRCTGWINTSKKDCLRKAHCQWENDISITIIISSCMGAV
ncbi:hypothetical protein TNCV_798391 [Trichonephila clavipes]|nr:hypothetical protein TNCV_798391 [Trichonephila clavipes]